MGKIFAPDLSGGSSPLTTKGDVFTYSTQDARLPVGTNGQFLKVNSATATGLEWGSGSANLSYLAVSASTAVTSTYNYYAASAAGATITLTLPTAVGSTGLFFEFEKTDSTFTPVFIQGISLQPLNVFGATLTSLNTQGERLRIVSDGATGWIANRTIPAISYTSSGTFVVSGSSVPIKGTSILIDQFQLGRSSYWAQGSYTFAQAVGGIAGSGIYLQNLPAGIIVDGTKVTIGISGAVTFLGDGYISDSADALLANTEHMHVYAFSSTQLAFRVVNNALAFVNWTQAFNAAFNTTRLNFSYHFRFPVRDWNG